MSAEPSFAPLAVLGLMTGTSLDGIDAVLVRLELRAGRFDWRIDGRESRPYPDDLRGRLAAALRPESSDVVLLTELHAEVGHAYAELVASVQARAPVDLVALSGQTVYHIPAADPARGWRVPSTLQLGEASIVTEACRVPVVSDFRQADMAAGGGGAPVVSFADFALLSAPGRARAIHNLGGISNLTYLPGDGDPTRVLAFDTGPANCLIDEAVEARFGLAFDEGGRIAATGRVDETVLAALLSEPYYRDPPPKTTGRERFNLPETARLADLDALSGADLVATLSALTAESVARAYRDHVVPLGLEEILVAGGGALNPTLMAMLEARLDVPLRALDDVGLLAKDREALAFAVMAYCAWHNLPNTLPAATGARHPVVAGKLSRPPPG